MSSVVENNMPTTFVKLEEEQRIDAIIIDFS